jgi:hypothetical protein
MYILTGSLYGDDAIKTDFWVEIEQLSNRTQKRVSINGINSLDLNKDFFKGRTITEIEFDLKKLGYMLTKVDSDRIYFKKI